MTGTGGGQSAFSQVFVQNINTEYRSIIPYRHGNLQSVNCPASGKDMRRLSLPDLSIKTLRSAGFHAMINMYKYTFFWVKGIAQLCFCQLTEYLEPRLV